jgi:hypothetical protein
VTGNQHNKITNKNTKMPTQNVEDAYKNAAPKNCNKGSQYQKRRKMTNTSSSVQTRNR